MAIIEYIEQLESKGKLFFTRKQLLKALHTSSAALNVMIFRLKKEGRIISLRNGCYVLVPLLYKGMGAPPIEWYLDEYMKSIGVSYYVGLLTAASYHGSSHQSPQIYHIITTKKMKPLKVGRTHISFVYKNEHDFNQETVVQQLTTQHGYIRVSSPESTAFDLLIYQCSTGSLNNIAAVIAELVPKLKKDSLKELVKKIPSTYSQRLGYILDKHTLEEKAVQPLLLSILEGLERKDVRYRLLQPASKTSKAFKRDSKWHLIINTQLEIDTL